MKRILYFTGYRMVAQEWSGQKLMSSVYFEPDDQGLDLFDSYLRSFRNEPVRLLVDLIEEEFRQVRVPLLRGADRKAILDRNFAKYFRSSEYKFAISQSREKKTRKEEKLLLIGLTNQFLLEPWLKVLDNTQTPLSGIISLPLLSEDYIKELKSEHRAVILVSQQVPSNLRQSVFVDGRLVLSRLVPIASFYQGDYPADVLRDVESTQRYLISQRIVERSETVGVHILTNKRHFDKMVKRCEQESFFDFKIYEINQLLEREKIDVQDEQDFSSGLYCFLATKKLMLNHYARPSERRYYQHHKAALALKVASLVLVTVGIGMALSGVVHGWLYDSTITQTQLMEQKYRSKFNQIKETSVDSSTSTLNMQNIVKTVNAIQEKYLLDPEEMFVLISNDLSIFPDIRVKKIEWFVSDYSGDENATEVSWGSQKRRSKRSKTNESKTGLPPKKGFFEIAVVDGEFINFDGDYRYALSVVDDLGKAMSDSGNYYSIEITKRPLDIESDNVLSGDVSVGRGTRLLRAEVGFRLVREVKIK